MSKATEVLAEFVAAGAAVRVDNGELVIDAPPGKVTAEMLSSLKRHKTELILMIQESQGCSWSEWKAARLNRMFAEQGVTGQRGWITASIVEHGERPRHITPTEGVAQQALEFGDPQNSPTADDDEA